MRMETVRLNTKLITSLPGVLFMPTAEMIVRTGIPNSTWYRIMQTPATISIQQLLAIANGTHVPVRRFFSSDGADYIGKRDEYIADPYEPCYYDDTVLQDLVDSSRKTTWQKAAKATGINYTNLRRSLTAVTRTPVARFLDVCGVFGVDPFTVLVDPNPEMKRACRESGHEEKEMPNVDIDALREDVRRLSRTVDQLIAKYQALLEANKILVSRLDKHIRDSYPTLASEP